MWGLVSGSGYFGLVLLVVGSGCWFSGFGQVVCLHLWPVLLGGFVWQVLFVVFPCIEFVVPGGSGLA